MKATFYSQLYGKSLLWQFHLDCCQRWRCYKTFGLPRKSVIKRGKQKVSYLYSLLLLFLFDPLIIKLLDLLLVYESKHTSSDF